MHTLHLEDSPQDGELIQALLRAEWPNCQITRVETREQFETAIGSVRFDLILSDNSLPDFDGNSALEEAMQVCPDTPFIFISGTLGEERAIEALRRGAADYVVKDRPARLVPAIRQAFHRNRVEQDLRHHRERFRQIAESVTDMIKVLDLDGRCIYFNPGYRALLGEDYAAQHGADPFSEIHPDDRDRVEGAFREVLRTGQPQPTAYRLVLPGGGLRHVEAQGSIMRDHAGRVTNVLVVARDVTVRRDAELRLQEQAALLDKADDAILVRDLEGRVTYWNKGAERLYGWTAQEIASPETYARIYRSPQQRQAAQQEALAEGEWTGELRQVTKAGKEIRVHSRWTLLRGPDGAPGGILSLSRDITEQKELETQLLRSQRLESIGMLAGGIAHDLNNVLAPILMSVNLLQEKVADPEPRRMLDILESSAHRGADLVKQVLAFARGAEGERTELQPKLVIRDVARLLAETLPRSITIETEFAEDLWLIASNSTELGQVVMNLCVNARDAMANGGTLFVRARNLEVGEAQVRSNPDAHFGPHVLISVADTGSGIPPEIIDRIFDPFFTTKAAGKGTGLGLSTVLGIVKSHGGFLQVDSQIGRGTEFRLHFPAIVAGSAAPARKAEAPLPRARGETILLIEDEDAVRRIAKALLESRGYGVIAAPDGATGIALYRDRRSEIDGVLTDMMMPGLQGGEVVAGLREINPDARVVVMSGVFGDTQGIVEEPGRLTFLQSP